VICPQRQAHRHASGFQNPGCFGGDLTVNLERPASYGSDQAAMKAGLRGARWRASSVTPKTLWFPAIFLGESLHLQF